ncbi:MAG: BatA domain-containing protein [Tepidisphaerales bacterium]
MWLNPFMLAGLGGAVVPLLLHLLARARYREVNWGAMMFLEGLDARQSQSTRTRQWILLGLRMLLVALLAMALARPVVRGRWAMTGGSASPTAVIVLDCSYSMGRMDGGRSRFERARDAVRQILWALDKGTEVSVVLLGDELTVLYPQPTTNLQNVTRDLDGISLSSGCANFAEALAAARKILDQPSRVGRELYLVTDRQAESWRRVDPAAASAAWLRNPQRPTRFYVIPVGGEESDNVAIESVHLVEEPAIRGQSAEAEIRIRNYAPVLRPAVDVTVSVLSPSDEAPRRSGETPRRVKTASVTIPARSSASIRIPVSFEQAGSHVVSAGINASGLEVDNHYDLAVEVIEPIELLIVSGDETGPPESHESFFLKLALSPYQSVLKKPGDMAHVTVKTAEEVASLDMAKYQVIVLANIPAFNRGVERAIEQRVYEGAGLILCPGNLTRVENFNDLLFRDGGGLSPARLMPPVPPDPSRATTLLGIELQHPVFRFRRGSDPRPEAVVARYFPAVPRPGDAKVLATLSSGDPFLVEAPCGRGKVLLLTSPLDVNWNTLPLYPFFLPFVQSLVRYAAPSPPPRNVKPGEPLTAVFDEPIERAEIVRNDERPIPVVSSGRTTQVRYTETQHPGLYRLLAKVKGNDRVVHFVVQPPRQESDLTPLSEENWRRLSTEMPFVRLDLEAQAIGPILAADRHGHELWLVLLAAAILAAAAELALTRLWSVGSVS